MNAVDILKTIVVLIFLTCGVLAQQKPLPRFEDYPVKENFRGKSAPVKLTSRGARAFRTRLRENAERGVNFAGHYIAAIWGCGSACWSFAIIDARTGQVYFIPSLLNVGGYGYSEEDLIQFRKDSRLLIVVGAPNDEGYVGRYYYIWKNNRLKLIRAVEDREWRPPVYRPTPPNNSFNRSANSIDFIENLDGFEVVCAPG